MIASFGDPVKEEAQISAIDVAETVFAPENIYWNPESKQVPETWLAIWNRALDMGRAILAAGFGAEGKWSPDEFWSQFNRLRSEIRAELFGAASASAEIPAENQAIATILERVLDKWRREPRPTKTPDAVEDADTIILGGLQPTEDTAETLILSPGATPEDLLSAERRTDEEETLILSPDNGRPLPKPEIGIESTAEERLQATVVLSPEDRLKQAGTEGVSPDEEPLQETVILAPKSRPMRSKPEVEPSDEELIQETVILSPGNSASKPAGGDALNSNLGKADLSETVVLPPGGKPSRPSDANGPKNDLGNHTSVPGQPGRQDIRLKIGTRKGEDPSQDDDILTETVILRPQKNKDSLNE